MKPRQRWKSARATPGECAKKDTDFLCDCLPAVSRQGKKTALG